MDDNICRICLEECNITSSIFGYQEVTFAYEKLLTMLNIQNLVNGPHLICKQCHTDLENSIQFLEKCLKSNKILSARHSTCKPSDPKSNCLEQDCNKYEETKNLGREPDIDADEGTHQHLEIHRQQRTSLDPCTEYSSKLGCERRCPTVHTCHFCSKVFTRKYNFSIHVKRHLGQREWSCGTCGAAQVSASAARRHCGPRVRRVCPAPGCRRSYTSTHNLTIHIRSHTGEKPHICVDCGKRFTSKTVLNDHRRIHSGVKPYMCAVCGARFATNKLAAHLRTHERGAKPRAPVARDPTRSQHEGDHPCPYCSSRYSHKQSLNRHVRKRHAIAQKIDCSATESLNTQIDCFT